MDGVSDWTRHRARERLDELQGDGAMDAATPCRSPVDVPTADPVAVRLQTLGMCSLLQILTFGIFLGLFVKELSPSPLIYTSSSLGLGILGFIFSCFAVTGRWMLVYIMMSCLVVGLVVDPILFAIQDCSTDCVTCSPEKVCPYCCYAANSQPCSCNLVNLAVFTAGLSLEAVAMCSALALFVHTPLHPDDSDAYHRLETPSSSSTAGFATAASAGAGGESVASSNAAAAHNDEMRKKLQQEARFAANRVFR
mmetsp:Transcript_102955/g.165833  ORF Transcript_102955/g.165833 Transcript_102955/m.165833 type:complete len:252 (+) Transcript_102955:98-853(+)